MTPDPDETDVDDHWEDASADAETEPADMSHRDPTVRNQYRPTHRELIDFENAWAGTPGAKQAAMRDTFGLSAARYYQCLHWMIHDPAALELDPILIHRLLKASAARVAQRASRTFTRTA